MTTDVRQFLQRERMLQNMGLRARNLSPRKNPETARLNDGSRQPMPYDPYNPQTIDDIAASIRQAAAQTETVSLMDQIFALRAQLQVLEQKVGVLYPPMPRGTGSGGEGIIDIRYNTSNHSIEVTSDGSLWTAKILFSAQTFTAVSSNTYNTSAHTLNYITSTFTAYIPEAIGGSANAAAVFETAVLCA